MNRRGLLATIHCAKRNLGLDDDTYRAILERVGKCSSARDLDDAALVRVVEEFRARGWKGGGKPKPSDKAQVRKIWGLWKGICELNGARNPTRAGLRAFVRNLTSVTDPEWLSPEQAIKVIENLKSWQARLRRGAS